MSAFSATHLNTDKLAKVITQVGHGFQVGTIVIYDLIADGFVKSIANSEVNCAGSMMVSFVIDANTFGLTQCGYVSNLTLQALYVPGAIMYVSPTNPGELTYVKPTAVGQVELECFYTDSFDSGFFFGGPGDLIESGSLFQWTVLVDMDASMVSNNGYLMTATAATQLTLPLVSAVGDVLKIATSAISTDDVLVVQDSNQYIVLADQSTMVGPTGGLLLAATNGVKQGSCELLCIEANKGWRFVDGTGTWDLI